MRRSFLRKGTAAFAAMLMGANVMAQGNVFIENTEATFSTDNYFIPSEITADNISRLLLRSVEKQSNEDYGWDVGWQVLNEDLIIEKEFKMFTIDEILNTRVIVHEQLDADGKWIETRRETREIYMLPMFQYRSTDCNYLSVAAVSQTLFNNDEKYEAIVPVFGGEVIEHEEGNSERTIYKNYVATSYKIINEDNETLYTLEAGDNMFFSISEGTYYQQVIKIGDKIYLVVCVGSMNTDNYNWQYGDSYRWYEICKETSSINFVRETRGVMNIAPTIADRDAQITITLNDDNNSAARELIITGVNGQLVERRTIPAGENIVEVSATMMRSGMYNFTLQKKGEVVDNGKVIVK